MPEPKPRPAPPCPICGKPAAPRPLAPFCSERCRQVDLGRWLTEAYAVPGAAPDEEAEGGRGVAEHRIRVVAP